METELVYMSEMQNLECDSKVERIFKNEAGKDVIVLDRTVFYPQGGGQPYDTGEISADNFKFKADEVRFIDGEVLHIGEYISGAAKPGNNCKCKVDSERRALNTRLHSGGHVIDMAITQLGLNWTTSKGYHFPDGPYAEYLGELESDDKEELIDKLNLKIAEIISSGLKTELKFMDKSEMHEYCHYVPKFLPEDKPGRVVLYGDFGMACGGTHVAEIADVGTETIRKIRVKNGAIRISYRVQQPESYWPVKLQCQGSDGRCLSLTLGAFS